ncbi:hypothetical protein ABEB36_014552 [Hypothenemus hampei]|uniref:Uncharacterized protein n=1 Tax=Hypothenemus hampei TaxID=57062 RepID=A0ABD1E248_HYPHA
MLGGSAVIVGAQEWFWSHISSEWGDRKDDAEQVLHWRIPSSLVSGIICWECKTPRVVVMWEGWFRERLPENEERVSPAFCVVKYERAEAIFEYVCSLLGVVREEILNWPGIPLGVLEEKFFAAVGDPGVLVRVGIWTFGRLLEMSPGIIVYEGRCYLVGVDEDSSSDDSDYFVVDDSSSEDSDYFSE